MSTINLQAWQNYSVTFAAGAAQTDTVISPTVDTNSRFEVIDLRVCTDEATTAGTACRIGFGAATVPAAAATPVAGVILAHPGIPSGMETSGAPGMGLRGEDLRCTCEDPAGGSLTITYAGRIVPA